MTTLLQEVPHLLARDVLATLHLGLGFPDVLQRARGARDVHRLVEQGRYLPNVSGGR